MKEVAKEIASLAQKPSGQELFQSIRNDELVLKELRKLGLSDSDMLENLPLIADFQEDFHICLNCPGVNECPKPFSQTKVDLIYENKRLTRRMDACEKNNFMTDPKYAFDDCDFPEEWFDRSRFGPSKTKRTLEVFKTMKAALLNEEHPWVYLMGEEGSGKSFLMASFAMIYAIGGKRISYLNTPSSFDRLKEISVVKRTDFDAKMVRLATVDLLILDDFGNEYRSAYERDTILFPLLRLRSEAHLPTFFGSRYPLAGIQDLYSFNRTAHAEAVNLVDLIASEILDGKALVIKKGFETQLNKAADQR